VVHQVRRQGQLPVHVADPAPASTATVPTVHGKGQGPVAEAEVVPGLGQVMSAAAGQVAVWLTIVVALWCAWRMRRDEQGRK
jgi:hypothetical protein